MTERKKVVLAYSGGLDTSVILKWLELEGYEVIAYVADVGQQDDFERSARRRSRTGASKVFVEDLKEEFVTDFIFPAFKANAIYEGRYLLGTALARPLIAKRRSRSRRREGAHFVAHGATGQGQRPGALRARLLRAGSGDRGARPLEDAGVPAPQFAGRPDLLAFAEEHGIDVQAHARQAVQRGREPAAHQPRGRRPRGPGPRRDRGRLLADRLARRTRPTRPTRIVITFKDGDPASGGEPRRRHA